MPKESTQHKLDRVRSPRVHLTYDLEVGGAIQIKELPFVVGVMGDFSGNPAEPGPRLKERKFVTVDGDNFDQVLAGMKPRLAFKAENKLAGDGSQLSVELNFRSLRDFEPEQVVTQVEPLRKLLDARRRLSDLLRKIDGNENLEAALQEVINNTEALKKVGAAAGIKGEQKKEEGDE